MSGVGRGRGYTGRHHLRESRPGDERDNEENESVRTLLDLRPRTPDAPKPETKGQIENRDVKDLVEIKYHVTSKEDEAVLQELLAVDDTFAPLLTLLEQFSPGEDGIQFNSKLRHFETTISNICPDETRLQQAFATFRAAALSSAVTARKLAAVGASFTRQQRQQLLRTSLLNVVMQGTFSKIEVLQRANPVFLINAANLMGDYFGEARLCNGNKVHILASPLLQYMKALLACDDVRAHRSLATQLMQNGRELLSVLSQEIEELSISIRLRLINPPPITLIWLLLSADLCLNKFLPLPTTLQQFYASHLDLTTEESYSEVTYGSWKKSPERDPYRSDTSELSVAEKINQNISQLNLSNVSNEDNDTVKPKLRPILGAGAGLLRQEQASSQDTWASKSSLSKRYDLNSWRQVEEEKNDDPEPVFNPSMPPPNMQPNYPLTIPDYPPPMFNYTEQNNYPNYLQQGDGVYIQNQYTNNLNFTPQGDFVIPNQTNPQTHPLLPPHPPMHQNVPTAPQTNTSLPQANTNLHEANTNLPQSTPNLPQSNTLPQSNSNLPQNSLKATQANPTKQAVQVNTSYPPSNERTNSEVQNSSRRPVENWRKEKTDSKEEPKSRQRNWSRQRSKDSINEEEDKEKFNDSFRSTTRKDGKAKANRRNSSDETSKPPNRRHVSEVPRSQKYWDHDDRCDKDYNS